MEFLEWKNLGPVMTVLVIVGWIFIIIKIKKTEKKDKR